MPFRTGSGKIFRFPKRKTGNIPGEQSAGKRNKTPEFASLPGTRDRARAFIQQVKVDRLFNTIISNELPIGFTGGANIPRPQVVTDVGGPPRSLGRFNPDRSRLVGAALGSSSGFNLKKILLTGGAGVVAGALEGAISPPRANITILGGKDLTSTRMGNVARHEVSHSILTQQGVTLSDKGALQHKIIALSRVGGSTGRIKQLPAARLVLTTTGATQAAGLRSLFKAGERRALQRRK